MTPDIETSANQAANPYTAPTTMETQTEATGAPNGTGHTVSERSIKALRGTRRWVLLAGWSLLPIGLFTGLSALGNLHRRGARDQKETFESSAVSMIFSLCLFASGILLIRYGGQIKRLLASHAMADLDRALEMQRTYWQFVGACIAAFLLFVPFLLLLAKRLMATLPSGPM